MVIKEKFNNKNPIHRRRKEILVFTLIVSIFTSTIFIYNYLINSPTYSSDLPSINISCNEDINNDDYVDCIFELDSNRIKASIKHRGHTVAKYPKKGYRLQLSEQISLLGMRKDDDWILFALYNDHQRMQTKLSLELWRRIDSLDPTAILPESEYVKLFLNGEFQGLYLLAEKNDRKLYHLDDAQNNIHSSLIFQAKTWSTLNVYENEAWEQDWPNEDDNLFIMDKVLTDLITFINSTSNEIFFDPVNGIYSKFDKLNLIDFYIFNFFIDHRDFWSKNYFIVRQTYPNKFFFIPWDFDSSIGSRYGLFNPHDNQETVIRERNELYNRLLGNEEFKKDCMERWLQLRVKLWSEEYLLNLIQDFYDEIKEILPLELEMWERETMKRKNLEIDDYISNLLNWMPDRLAFCDSYFSEV